jgi:hypothetical protein
MCVENIQQIISLNFATTNDELNWINNSANPITTTDGKLILQPESALSVFSRQLGTIDPVNNRVRFKLNLEIYCPPDNGTAIGYYLVQIFNGVSLVGQSTIYLEGMDAGQVVKYSLDRTYKYEELSGNISIKIKASQGWQNEIRLVKLDVWDQTFCEENVRTYFVFDGLFEASQNAQSAGIRCLTWKVDGVETLTNAFNSQNQSSVGGNPVSGWKYAKADIDGANRDSAATGRNTFNPFADEFGLIFENVSGNFWGGKPTGTVGGQNFGSGVMSLGFEKPVILNDLLQLKAGAFFIDIDYTKDLYIEMDVLVNNNSTSVYNNPNTYRRFVFKWDATTCKKDFYYLNQLQPQAPPVDQNSNGFLTGLTDTNVESTILPCGQTLTFNGNQGAFTFTLDLGTAIGLFGINYNAQDVPDKFDLLWNNVFQTSNYRGKSTYNQALINSGIPVSQINTANPSNGAGQLRMFKTTAFPTTATVTVTAPLGGTAWRIDSVCPLAYMEIWLYRAVCGDDISGTPTAVKYLPSENPLTYVPANGDVIFDNTALTTPYNGGGNVYKMRIPMGTSGAVTEVNFQFNVAVNGVISGLTPC